MERTRRPGRAPLAARPVTVAGVLIAVSLMAGCSAGFDATSGKPYAPSDGIQVESGDLRVLNALVVAGEAGTTGVVSTTIANTGSRDDRLTDLTSPDGAVQLSGSRDLPAGAAVTLGASTDPAATVSGLTRLAGQTITLKISFARAEPVTLNTVVVAATGDYADLGSFPATPTPTPLPVTPTATPTTSP